MPSNAAKAKIASLCMARFSFDTTDALCSTRNLNNAKNKGKEQAWNRVDNGVARHTNYTSSWTRPFEL